MNLTNTRKEKVRKQRIILNWTSMDWTYLPVPSQTLDGFEKISKSLVLNIRGGRVPVPTTGSHSACLAELRDEKL